MKEPEYWASITLLANPAEFTMICAPEVFFYLASQWGLIHQADSKSIWWAFMSMNFIWRKVTIQKKKKKTP